MIGAAECCQHRNEFRNAAMSYPGNIAQRVALVTTELCNSLNNLIESWPKQLAAKTQCFCWKFTMLYQTW